MTEAPPPIPTRVFALRGVDSRGRTVEQRIAAVDSEGAVRQAAKRGLENIEVLADDFTAILPDATPIGVRPADPDQVHRVSKRTPAANEILRLLQTYHSFGWLPATGVVILIARRFLARPPGVYDAVLLGLLFVPLALWALNRNRPSDLFRRMQLASVEADFQSVLDLADEFERVRKGKLSEEYVIIVCTDWRSKTLARLGRLEEALELVDRLKSDPRINPAVYWHQRAQTYSSARQYDRALECYQEFTRLEPNNAMGWFGLIDTMALWLNRPAEARAAFKHLQELPVSGALVAGVQYSEAMILLAESKFAEARSLFETCLPHFVRTARSTPIARGLVALIRAQLAIACAKTADMEAARRYLRDAEPFLKLHRVDALLARARTAVGASE
ncbi:MAG: tetratricopeptide repeat protein [Planctomycetes bacterium]|nr:tetratricopeptide repeat protein [Planctomycetota bacterium]